MFSIRFAIPIVALAALAFPGIASANTGYVTCESTGVVFHYNTDFGRTKVVTETVNGVSKQFTVPARTAVSDTWPVFGTSIVGATWSGGSIPTVTLDCPAPPTLAPPVIPPVPVAPPVVPPVAPPVETPAAPVAPPAVTPSTSTAAPAPKLSLRKRALAKSVAAGSTVRYQLVVKATGGTAHNVVVCDNLPAHMTYASLGTSTLQDGHACWTVGDLTGSLTLSLTAKLAVGATQKQPWPQPFRTLNKTGAR